MTPRRRAILALASTAVVAALPRRGRAGPRLDRPLRIIVGFPPGGPLDIAARTIAPFLGVRLGRAVVVDNRPGASGNLATADVVRATPDGDTLLLCGPVNTINTSLFGGLAFDFERDIAPVALIASVPLIIEVGPALAVRSIPALLDVARTAPGRLRVGFAGVGTPQHLAIKLFEMATGVTVTLVPYAGSAPAIADLLTGRVDAMFDPAPSSLPYVRDGRLTALATTGAARAAVLPDIPALHEFVAGYEANSWFGLGAPRAIPARAVARLNAAVNAALADVAVQARFADLGATVLPGSPARFGAFIAAETERYRVLVRRAALAPA